MYVLHVLCDLSGGGAERLVLDLCRHSPFRTSVAAIHSGGALAGEFAAAGVEVVCLQRQRGRPGARAVGRLARLARGADIVHTHLWAGDFWGRPGAWLGRTPVITTEHNTRAESPLRQRIWTAMAPLSRAIVCVSQAAAQAVVASGVPASRIRVIDNGIDLGRFTPAPRPGTGGILAIGRLTRQKGFDVLIEALRLAPCPATILGEGEDRAALEEQAAGLPVSLPGWVSDIRPWLAEAEVLVIPSRWEGFGLIAAEAMASGVPVIASRVDGLVEVIGDAGILIPPEDPVALAAALSALRADPHRQKTLSRRGLLAARRLSIQTTIQCYEALYREVLRDCR